MADIIDLTTKLRTADNLVTASPLEFRRGEWQGGYALLCTRGESIRFEAHRLEALKSHGHRHIASVPSHFTLDGGYHYTIGGLFRYRSDESIMRRVYHLAGLMECVTNASSHILRTDLLRHFYKSILEERDKLQIVWRGHVRHFLLPLHPDHRNPNLFFHEIAKADSLKELYAAIRSETDKQFDILSSLYVCYLPESSAFLLT